MSMMNEELKGVLRKMLEYIDISTRLASMEAYDADDPGIPALIEARLKSSNDIHSIIDR